MTKNILKYSFYTLVTIVLAVLIVQSAKKQSQAIAAKTSDVPDQRKGSQVRPANPASLDPENPENSPYIKGVARLSENKFDYGFVPQGSSVYHPFYIANVGTDTLHIVKVQPG